ncbi:hypothetical protein, partial [Mammaliicoccus sciuri]|uniref:hypothetical protein n=1 Tax=Mammaliicoccus sciuri TaxID=1296 RepID=UPI003F8CF379
KPRIKNNLLTILKNDHIDNVIDLMTFLDIYGEEYGIDNMNYVQDVITSNASAFRLWFVGNYQCGYRARYSRIIDSESG